VIGSEPGFLDSGERRVETAVRIFLLGEKRGSVCMQSKREREREEEREREMRTKNACTMILQDTANSSPLPFPSLTPLLILFFLSRECLANYT
jgi:hypothetical protein